MATLSQSFLSLNDLYKREEGKNRAAANISEVLNDTSQDIMSDWMMMQCNSATKHVATIRSGLPSVAWGQLYKGIPQSKSATQQIEDTTGFVEAMITVDERLLDLAGDKRNAVRAQESRAFLESIAQEAVSALFYHNTDTDPRLPKGLSARFFEHGNTGAANQVVNCGGTGSDNTSMWMVCHGGEGLHILYPEGTAAGIKQENLGRQRVLDKNGNPFMAEEEKISLHMGVHVRDYRYISRLANIDVNQMADGNVDLFTFLRKGFYKMQDRRSSKIRDDKATSHCVIYANTDVLEALDGLATNSGAGDNYTRLRYMEIEGKEVLSYRGMPIRECDALLNTEAVVPAAA